MSVVRHTLVAIAVGSALGIAGAASAAVTYSFSGISAGGVASATMEVDTQAVPAGSTTFIVKINNTTNDANPLYDDAAITAFGFDLDPASVDFSDATSWSLQAYDAPSGALITIGSSTFSSCSLADGCWELTNTNSGVSLDLVSSVESGINGGLLNPSTNSDTANRYFTQATLTVVFPGTVTHVATADPTSPFGICAGNDPCTPFVRFQSVGNGGSLKLTDNPGGGPPPSEVVPEPSLLGLMGIGALVAGLARRRRR